MKYCRRFWLTFIMFVCFSVSLDAQYESLFGNYQTSWNVKTSQLFGSVLDSTSYERDTVISSVLQKELDITEIQHGWLRYICINK